jgi:rod shape-determining protein MreD
MNNLIKNIFRFSILIFFQVFVLDKIRLNHLITPYIYFIFILWLPFEINRSVLMITAFLLGFTIDAFRHHPGFHAAACVLLAYTRPFMINLLVAQQGSELNYDEPSMKSMGGALPYLIYSGTLIFVHHLWLFLLEAFQFSNWWYFLIKTLLSTLLSLLLLFSVELLFSRNQKFKTNTQ